MACKRFLVSGKVQGVWFRASTREQATGLGLTGHAINLPDGRVEVVACGGDAALDALETWLWQGPELASVEQIDIESLHDQVFDGFRTG